MRRQHDARRTFRSLCLSGGAGVTRGRPGDAEGLDDQITCDALCAEIGKLKVTTETGKVIALPRCEVAASTAMAWYRVWVARLEPCGLMMATAVEP